MYNHSEKSWGFKVVLCLGILAYGFPAGLAAESITGIVRNQTQGGPAAGEIVILLSAGKDVHEEARAKTDAQGAFALDTQFPDKPHMVRVLHQGISYDQRVSAGKAIAIDVADAAAKVQGITGNIEIIRASTHGNLLHVSDMIEIKNASNPPVTQAAERTFEVYLPAQAVIDSVLAAGPQNIAMTISATPVRSDPGHYTVNFPLHPGATKFAFNYDVPYNGHATFRAKNVYALQQLAVMVPPTMTFTSRASAFKQLPLGTDRYHVEAAEHVKAGAGLEFEISGAGTLPATQPQNHVLPEPPGTAVAGSVPAIAAATSSNTSPRAAQAHKAATQSSFLWWWVLGVAAVLTLGICGLLIYRRQRPRRAAITPPLQMPALASQPAGSIVDALKEGLFQLESDRVRGTIHEEEYASAKHALEGTIRWAVARKPVSKKKNVAV